jgi:poly-gamma-glutamate synthesis protein (capsule biosynthesis protein)
MNPVDIKDTLFALINYALRLPALFRWIADRYRRIKPIEGLSPVTFSCEAPSARGVTIAATGDVLVQTSILHDPQTVNSGFASLFAEVSGTIKAADLSVVNFEGVVDPRKPSGFGAYAYPPELVAALKGAGFDVLQLGNNHALDRGPNGVDETLRVTAAAGLGTVGTRAQDNAQQPWHTVSTVRKGGNEYTIAWLACTFGVNRHKDPYRQTLRCYRDQAEIVAHVRKLANMESVHAVIVLPHWGWEYNHRPSRKQRHLARSVLEAGAAAVIGTHPHVVQPLEQYNTSDGRQTLIAYSLGNFISNQPLLSTQSSVILLLGLEPAEDKLAVHSVGWLPLKMRQQDSFYVEPIDAAKSAYDARDHLRHLHDLLPGDNLLRPALGLWDQSMR